MFYFLLRIIQLLLPYGLILQLYKYDTSLPANIKTRSGRMMKAVMITENYGIIVSQEKYQANKAKKLMEQQEKINEQNKLLAQEFNKLSFEMKEEIFSKEKDEEV